jgi:outer membrane biosynthesis protein TonB
MIVRNVLLTFLVAVALAIAGTLTPSSGPGLQKEAKSPAPHVGLAVEILSKTNGTDFSRYITHLIESLKPNISAHLPESAESGKKGIVTLQIQLQKDGSIAEGYPVAITQPGIQTSTAYKEMEAASITAVRTAAPYGPMPEAFSGSILMLKIHFFFNIPPGRAN